MAKRPHRTIVNQNPPFYASSTAGLKAEIKAEPRTHSVIAHLSSSNSPECIYPPYAQASPGVECLAYAPTQVTQVADPPSYWSTRAIDSSQAGATIYSVSCATNDSCVGVGGNPQSFSAEVLYTNNGGQSWSDGSLSGASNVLLRSVSCSSPTSCAALGEQRVGTTIDGVGYYSVDGGITWSQASGLSAANQPVGSPFIQTFGGVSCSGLFCIGTGGPILQPTGGSIEGGVYVTSGNGGASWSVSTFPTIGTYPPSSYPNTFQVFGAANGGISCSNSSNCVAAGVEVKVVQGAQSVVNGVLTIPTTGYEAPASETTSNGGQSWALSLMAPFFEISNTPTPPSLVPTSISCGDPSNCTAIGIHSQSLEPTTSYSWTTTNGGKTWSQQALNNGAPSIAGQVSCLDDGAQNTDCVQASSLIGGSFGEQGVIESQSSLNPTWTSEPIGTNAYNPGAPSSFFLGAISCASPAFCASAGVGPNLQGGSFELAPVTLGSLPVEQGCINATSFSANSCSSNKLSTDPVTGALRYQKPDLSVAGPGLPLNFTRTYNSNAWSTFGPLGYGWTDSYNISLEAGPEAGDITISGPAGSITTFTPGSANSFEPPPGFFATLSQSSSGYQLIYDSDKIFNFTPLSPSGVGLLVSESDLNGNSTNLSYNSNGDLEQITDATGRQLDLSYNPFGVLSSISSQGQSATFTYSSTGDLSSVTDVGGGITTFTYSSDHYLLSESDPLLHTSSAAYNSLAQVESISDPMGNQTSFTYSGQQLSGVGGQVRVVDPLGNVELETFSSGNLVSDSQGSGAAISSYTYEPGIPEPITSTNPDGNTSTNTYDPLGDVLSSTNPSGQTTTYTYNSLREMTSSTTPQGVTTTYTYNSQGNLIEKSTQISPGVFQTTTYDVAPNGDILSETDPNGNTTTYTYDQFGNLASQTNSLGDTTTYTYNTLGEKTSTTDPNGNKTTYTYNAYGEMVSSTNPLGETTKDYYDADHNLIESVDPLGNITQYIYNLDNELVQEIEANGSVIKYTYDGDGDKTSYTDANGHTTYYKYNSLNELVETINPLGASTTYGYDPSGNQVSTTNADGYTTTTTYNQNGQAIATNSSQPGVAPTSKTYNPDGQLTSLTDGTGTSTYSYDALGRLISQSDGSGATTTYTYDNQGNLTSISYPNSDPLRVTYTYNAANQMTSETDWQGNKFIFSYDKSGNLISQSYPNSVDATYTYNALNQISSIQDASGSNILASYNYTRNPNGLVATQATSTPNLSAIDQSYSYSQINQLISDNSSNYTYDPSGNITSLGSGTSLSYNQASELTSSTQNGLTTNYTYDANGNRIHQGPGGSSGSGVSCMLCVLDPTKANALSATGNSSITSSNPIAVNSSSISAISATGSSQIVSKAIYVVGNAKTTGSATIANLTQTGASPTTNPLLSFSPPTITTTPTKLDVTGAQIKSATPGTYSSISVSGNAKLTLDPGTYVLEGPMKISGGAQVTANGVTIILSCSSYPSNCTSTKSGPGLSVSGNGKLSIDKGMSGPGYGVAIYSTDPSEISATGSGSIAITGSIDTPSGQVTSTGNASIGLTDGDLIADSVGATGSGEISLSGKVPSVPSVSYVSSPNGLTSYSSSNGISQSYTYNANNLRMSQTSNGTTILFHWDTANGQTQLLSDSANYYIYGPNGLPIEQINIATATPTYLYSDQLGSIRMECSSTGSIIGTQSYSDYGTLSSSTGTDPTPFGFAGGYTDPTGLIYLINRYYDPQTAQFISVDPLVQATGQPYSYTNGDPVNNTDSNGLVTGHCFAGMAGFILTIYVDVCHISDEYNHKLYTSTSGAGIGLGISLGFAGVVAQDAHYDNVRMTLGTFTCVAGSAFIEGLTYCSGLYRGTAVHELEGQIVLGKGAGEAGLGGSVLTETTNVANGIEQFIAQTILDLSA